MNIPTEANHIVHAFKAMLSGRWLPYEIHTQKVVTWKHYHKLLSIPSLIQWKLSIPICAWLDAVFQPGQLKCEVMYFIGPSMALVWGSVFHLWISNIGYIISLVFHTSTVMMLRTWWTRRTRGTIFTTAATTYATKEKLKLQMKTCYVW